VTSQPVDEAIAALVTTAAFLRTRPRIWRIWPICSSSLTLCGEAPDRRRRGPIKHLGVAAAMRFKSQMARVIVTPDKATKLAQSVLCVSDLVRRNAEEKPRRAKSAADMRRLRSNAYDGLGTSRSLCAISSIDTSRKVRTLALFTKRAGRYMSQTQASPMETS
jgi:hypothetical protein